MSWREIIAKRLMDQPRRYPIDPNAIPNAQWKAQQAAEQAFNRAQGDRGLAAQQAQETLDWYNTPRGPVNIPPNPRNVQRVEDTLGVLRSDEPLDAWWNK